MPGAHLSAGWTPGPVTAKVTPCQDGNDLEYSLILKTANGAGCDIHLSFLSLADLERIADAIRAVLDAHGTASVPLTVERAQMAARGLVPLHPGIPTNKEKQ